MQTVQTAKDLGVRLGVDIVVIGHTVKNLGVYNVAVMPTKGDTNRYENLNLTTTDGQKELLFSQLAEAVAYSVTSFKDWPMNGKFMAEGMAQLIVENLSGFLQNDKMDVSDATRADMVKAYEFAAMSVVKYYFWPSKPALDNYLSYCQALLDTNQITDQQKILYARALHYSYENRERQETLDKMIRVLESLPVGEDGKRDEMAEYWLDYLAWKEKIEEDHVWFSECTKRGMRMFLERNRLDLDPLALLNLSGVNFNGAHHCGETERLLVLEQAEKCSLRATQNLLTDEPFLAAKAVLRYGEMISYILLILKGSDATPRLMNAMSVLESFKSDQQNSKVLTEAHYHSKAEILFAPSEPSWEPKVSDSTDWKPQRRICANAMLAAISDNYSPYNKLLAYNIKGDVSDLEAAIILNEQISDTPAFAPRGNLAHKKIAKLELKWRQRHIDGSKPNIDTGEIQEQVKQILLELRKLISLSNFPNNLQNHTQYLAYQAWCFGLQAEIFMDIGWVAAELSVAQKSCGLSYLVSAALDRVLRAAPINACVSGQNSAENALNLLSQTLDENPHLKTEIISVPEYMRPTFTFLDERAPGWREAVLGPSYHRVDWD